MRAHLDEETTRLAAIWRITRKDGQQFFFTDHDRDIVFGGDTYRADAGFERTAIRSDAGFAVDNLDLVGVFAEGGIVEDEVRAGLFDGAEIALSFVNWQDPDGHGEIRLRARHARRGAPDAAGSLHGRAAGPVPTARPEHAADLLPGLPRRSRRRRAAGSRSSRRCSGASTPCSAARSTGCPTAGRAGFQVYEDRIYEVTAGGHHRCRAADLRHHDRQPHHRRHRDAHRAGQLHAGRRGRDGHQQPGVHRPTLLGL